MSVLFVVDNRPDSGLGHVIRSKALAAELEGRGWAVEVIGPNDRPEMGHAVTVFDLRPDIRHYIAPTNCVQIVDDTEPLSFCDVVVNGCAGATPELYAGKVGDARVLAGPAFALLRPEFAAERMSPRRRKGVLDIRTISVWNAADLALEMASAQVAISYGGMRAMECACVGTPTVIIPRNDGERLNATGLLAAGACVIADPPEAQLMAETMLGCSRLLDKMSENARNLVDGKGCRRIAQIIQAIVQ